MLLLSLRITAGGSGDPVKNTTLANVLKAAKASGVPRDNIERAISRVRGLFWLS